MKKILKRVTSQFAHLRWKLAFSHFIVTVAALLVVELFVLIGVSLYVVNKAKTTPDELMANIYGSYYTLASRYLSKVPPDIAGFGEFLGKLNVNVVEVTPIKVGDFMFDVASTNILYVLYTDGKGVLIDALPHDFLENTRIGERFDSKEIPGMESPFRVALAGGTDFKRLISEMPDGEIVGAIPIYSEFEYNRVVGTLAFVHKSHFREVLNLPNLTKQVFVSLLFITLFAGILGTIFGFLTARGPVQRLKQLGKSAHAWSEGDFSVFVDDKTNDELGHLAEALNHMAVQLENLLAERQEMSVIAERNRLARELHDSVKQQAFAASAQLAAANARFDPDPESAKEHLNQAEKLVYEVRKELTDLIRELHPLALQGNGLSSAIRQYAKDCANQTGIDIDVLVKGERPTPLEIEQTLFRIIQGALSNVARHSEADNAQVMLIYDPEEIILTISDDGIGFDVGKQQFGSGLRSIRERAELVRGELSIESEMNKGTKVTVKCGC